VGPPERKPGLPDFEWTRAPASHRFVSKTWQQCNYLQGIEGGIDPTHGGFLHNRDISNIGALNRRSLTFNVSDERVEYGVQTNAVKDLGEDGTYNRIYQFVLPFHQLRPDQTERTSGGGRLGTPQVRGHMWVPLDDENTCVFNWIYASDEDRPFTPEFILSEETKVGRGPDGAGNSRRRTRQNDWLIDREMQRTINFTGIPGVNTQDLAAQESMGPIVNRAREHLGSADQAIILLRHILLDVVKDVREGLDPPGVDTSTYRGLRPVDVVLPHGVRWQEAIEDAVLARW